MKVMYPRWSALLGHPLDRRMKSYKSSGICIFCHFGYLRETQLCGEIISQHEFLTQHFHVVHIHI